VVASSGEVQGPRVEATHDRADTVGDSPHKRADDPVLVDPIGERLSDHVVRKGLYRAMAAAGIDGDRGTGKAFVFHDLRYTFGTLAVRAFPLSNVQAYMGHADVSTTMLYVHHTPQHDAADKLTALARSAGSLERVPAGTEPSRSLPGPRRIGSPSAVCPVRRQGRSGTYAKNRPRSRNRTRPPPLARSTVAPREPRAIASHDARRVSAPRR
jgi:hypothetical protein